MGSAAPLKRMDFATTLFMNLESAAKSSIADDGEADLAALVGLLNDALDNLGQRDLVVLYLAAYLSRCLTGSIPDHTVWHPPE